MRAGLLLLALIALPGCGPTPSPPAGNVAPATPAGTIALPTLDGVDAGVASQIRSAHDQWQQARVAGKPLTEQSELAGRLGMTAMAYEQYSLASAAFDWASDARRDDYRWRYLLARTQISQGKTEAAVASLRQVLKLDAGIVAARLILAEQLLERGDLPATAELLPSNGTQGAAMLGMRGRLALAQGDYLAAADLLRKALALEPDASRLRYPFGLALRGIGRDQEARVELARFGQVSPAVADPLMLQVQALAGGPQVLTARANDAAEGGDFERAIQLYKRALQAKDETSTRLNLAIALARNGANRLAEVEYRKVLEADTSLATAHFGLGSLMAAQGRDLDAVESYQSALEIDPGNRDALFNLANALYRLGRAGAAEKHFAQVVQLDPARADAWMAQASMLIELRQWDKAVMVLSAALKAHPDDAQVASSLARLLAAAPAESIRDGPAALALAGKLFAAERSLPHGEVLAMALAEVDRFDEAILLQQQLLDAARQQQRTDLVGELQAALNLYRSGKAFRLD